MRDIKKQKRTVIVINEEVTFPEPELTTQKKNPEPEPELEHNDFIYNL